MRSATLWLVHYTCNITLQQLLLRMTWSAGGTGTFAKSNITDGMRGDGGPRGEKEALGASSK